MKLSEAWRASKLSYTELVYRPILRSGFPVRYAGTKKSVRQALTGATLNKLIFAAFTLGGAVFPFVIYRLGLEAISLVVATALSMVLVFGYLVLYSVQVLPTFVTSGSFGPLTLLPLTPRERSSVALLTLWRTLDYILVLSLATECVTVAYFTGSATAAVLVLGTSLSASVLAIALALRLISVFQNRLERSAEVGGGRGLAALRGYFRPLLFVVWGLGVMSAVFLFSLISFVAPPLNSLLSNPGSPLSDVVSLLFPFSAGILVSSLSGRATGGLSLILGWAGVAIVVGGAALAALSVPRTIDSVVADPVKNTVVRWTGNASRYYDFRVRGRLPAYILKDLRVASRNPATGFLFALPLFEILAVVVPITATPVVRLSAILVGAQVGGGFALFTAFLLVTVEDLGIEKRSALPISESVRILSKVVVSTITYVPVPLALALILFVKPATFGGSIIIPFAVLASVFAACVAEVLVLNTLSNWGRGTAVRFISGVSSGEFVLLLPSLAFTTEYVFTHDRSVALLILVVVSAAELVLSIVFLRLLGAGHKPLGVTLATPGADQD